MLTGNYDNGIYPTHYRVKGRNIIIPSSLRPIINKLLLLTEHKIKKRTVNSLIIISQSIDRASISDSEIYQLKIFINALYSYSLTSNFQVGDYNFYIYDNKDKSNVILTNSCNNSNAMNKNLMSEEDFQYIENKIADGERIREYYEELEHERYYDFDNDDPTV